MLVVVVPPAGFPFGPGFFIFISIDLDGRIDPLHEHPGAEEADRPCVRPSKVSFISSDASQEVKV